MVLNFLCSPLLPLFRSHGGRICVREGRRERGRVEGGRKKMNRNIYYMSLSWRKGAGYNL